jgi:glycosyltransferase involved in cell wall biosynthesis
LEKPLSLQLSKDGLPTLPDLAPTVSVILPCLNEQRNLPRLLAQMPAGAELVLVDGGSTDGTIATVRELWPDVVVVQQTRKGKGNALVCGFAAASGDILVMLDGSNDPGEIPAYVEALVSGAEFAKGSRFCRGGHSQDITRMRAFGNAGLSFLVNRLFGARYSDLCYGYNAFWRWVLPHLDLPDMDATPTNSNGTPWGDGSEIEALINVRVAALGLHVAEICSVESEHLHRAGNLNAWRDGKRVLRTILREYRERDRHTFTRKVVLPQPWVPAWALDTKELPEAAVGRAPAAAVSFSGHS